VAGHAKTGDSFDGENKGPAFMISYARPSRVRPSAPDNPVLKLLDDLNQELGHLVTGYPEAPPGGFDQNMPLGADWKRRLAFMLAYSHVLIPLVSPPFLDSTWCGKEWFVFSEREVKVRPPLKEGDSAILPVIWVPVREDRMHPAVRRLQYDTLNMPPSYSREGLLALSRRSNTDDDYGIAVNCIAQRVSELLVHATVAPGRPVNLDTAPNAFNKRVRPTWEGVQFWHLEGDQDGPGRK